MTRIPPAALIGLFFTALYFLMAIFAPLIAPYGMAEVVGDVWEPSSREFLLGTDSIGRDLLSRMIYGGRTTIFIATAATLLSFFTGSILGFLAAVTGGWVDQVLSRFVDLIMSIPTLIFALVVLSVMPVTIPVLILVMGLLDSTRVYRLARAV
ncbi:MAG: ABC transporter permease, partial [Sedimentitalea sp.]|nr:ABC transporter permease [Sedimentitalea sp.]